MDDAPLQTTPMTGGFFNRRVLWVIGALLTLLSLLFVGERLVGYWPEIVGTLSVNFSVALTLGLSFLVCGLSFLLVLPWRKLMSQAGEHLDFSNAHKIYAISQIGKYVPGNIGQIALRLALNVRSNMDGKIIIVASLWEVLAFAAVGANFLWLWMATRHEGILFFAFQVVFVVSLLVSAWALNRILNVGTIFSFAPHLLFQCSLGLIFAFVVWGIEKGDVSWASALSLVAGYVLAFVTGMVTPGSPGGVGVREATALAILGNHVDGSHLLLAMIFMRVITLLGDLMFFMTGVRIPGKPK